jgi:hypothetical protein
MARLLTIACGDYDRTHALAVEDLFAPNTFALH